MIQKNSVARRLNTQGATEMMSNERVRDLLNQNHNQLRPKLWCLDSGAD